MLAKTSRTMACQAFQSSVWSSATSATRPGKIVLLALSYQAVGSRLETRTTASGKASISCGQKAAPGQSTMAS